MGSFAAVFLALISLQVADYPPATTIPWSTYAATHPERAEGFGPVVDDLEQHAPDTHPMRNEKDAGNWVHELTHQVQSDIRKEQPSGHNSFYIFGGRYLSLPEPNITLSQVGAEITESERGSRFNLYFQDQLRGWNTIPLYALDEATAYTNGFWYHVQMGEKSDTRKDGANEFARYGRAFIRTVRKHDPQYIRMKDLEAYVEWNARRVAYLTTLHDGGTPTPPIIRTIPNYILH
jgi:hypothetical protein